MPVHTPRVSTSWLCLLVERVSKRHAPNSRYHRSSPTHLRQAAPIAPRWYAISLWCCAPRGYAISQQPVSSRTHRASPLAALVRMPTQVSIHYAFRHSVRITAAATTHVLKLTGLGLGLGSGLGLGLGLGLELELGLGLGSGLAHNPSPNPNQVGTTCPRWTRTCSPPTSRTGARAYGRRSHYRL